MNMAEGWYILNDNNEPVPADVLQAVKWRSGKDRNGDINCRVALDNIADVRISTVFLGLDQHLGDGPPVLFETMIFGGDYDQYQWRYHTWDEAIAGHKAAVLLVSGN